MGYGTPGQDHGAGWKEQENGEHWQPGVLCSEQVLLGRGSGADGRAVGFPTLVPPDLASVEEAGRIKGMLLGPPHHLVGYTYSRVDQVQTHSHADGSRETGQDPLLECNEVDVAESELQALRWSQPPNSCSSQAQAAEKRWM